MSSIDELITALQSDESTVEEKINSIKSIGYSKNQRALEYLVDLLDDTNPQVVSAVIWAIGKYKEKKILPKIVPKIKDDDDNVRAIAIKTLSKFTKNQDVLDEILKLLNDGDPKIRIMVMDAVVNFEASSIIENIIERLEKDEDKEVKLKTIEYLGEQMFKDERATNALIQNLENEEHDFELKMAMIDQLAKIDPNVKEFLILALKGRKKIFIEDPLTQDEKGVDLVYRKTRPLVMKVKSFKEEIDQLKNYIEYLKKTNQLVE
ncbi:MAG: HEAT repeat domain-containing protein [Candidatus Hodarchaeota archaeon]